MSNNLDAQELEKELARIISTQAYDVFAKYTQLRGNATNLFYNILVFALGNERPLVATARLLDETEHAFELAVFTETKVLYVNAKSEPTPPKVSIIDRHSLTDLSLLEAPPVLTALFQQQARAAKYSLTYSNGISFELPMSYASGQAQELIDRMGTSLLEDLQA